MKAQRGRSAHSTGSLTPKMRASEQPRSDCLFCLLNGQAAHQRCTPQLINNN